MELRLGDVIDDHCIKCRRLTNHSIVSMVEQDVAKVRCRSCYHEHTYLHEQAPPSKKDLKKAELAALALADGAATPEGNGTELAESHGAELAQDDPAAVTATATEPEPAAAEPKGKSRSRKG